MTLTQPIVNHIESNFKNNTFYIGEKIKKTFPNFCNMIEKVVKCVSNDTADCIIDDDVYNFTSKIVITNIKNNFAKGYDLKIINKQQDIACYFRRDRVHNEHLICNPFELNKNEKLFKFNPSKEKKIPSNVKSLKDCHKNERVLIVGSGPSWTNINYNKLANDVVVFIVNYNFTIKSDYMIFTDSSIADYLKGIDYIDNRILIGFDDHVDGQVDYFYKINDPFKRCLHTTAYALQIANLMGFKEKYLIGCDYYRYDNGKDYCYKKVKNYTYKDSGGRVQAFIEDFNKFKSSNVYQLNPKSKLEKYPLAEREEIYD